MKITTIGTLLVASFGLHTVWAENDMPTPPVAKRIDRTLTMHGDERSDPYYWMNERDKSDVLAYLEAENAYTSAVTAPLKALEDKLFEETKARIKQDDSSVPYLDNGYWYYTRTEDGQQYPVICRRADGSDAEEILLDVNVLAEGKSFCQVGNWDVSPNGQMLAFAIDFRGRRIYDIRFKDLASGKMLKDKIEQTTSNLVWANDNQTLFYGRKDLTTLRSHQIYRHRIGDAVANDALVYEEQDDTFSCSVSKSRSRELLLIDCDQTLSTEVWYLDAGDPTGEFKVLCPRERDHEYSADHHDGQFYVRTNWDAENFRLMRVSDAAPAKENWEEVIPARDDVYLQGARLFDDFLVISERSNALTHIRVIDKQSGEAHMLDFGEPAYSAFPTPTPEPSTPWLRYVYSSMTTPSSIYEYNMETRERKLLKEDPVLGGFDRENYTTERLWATARDGTQVPISLVYHNETPRDGTAPCLVYGYGSYGSSMPASFRSTRLNLIDRGFVFAILHIRGGQEMGRDWYEGGKLLKKMNTFTDFIDGSKFLVKEGYADPNRLYAQGGSAGGLLMGAVINLRPDLYHGVIADVPFVDVVTTMLDDSIPLTTSEYDEWGNPNDKSYYDYMLSYSPYDNVQAFDYPNLLVLSGLHDSQVQYFEPTKWVAKLRATKTDDNLLLLKTNMDAGHGGASGRYDAYRELVFEQAFLLHLAGIEE